MTESIYFKLKKKKFNSAGIYAELSQHFVPRVVSTDVVSEPGEEPILVRVTSETLFQIFRDMFSRLE